MNRSMVVTLTLAAAVLPGRARSQSVPFAFADFTWLNGNSRQKTSVLDSKYFTGEFRLDATYIYDFNHPSDHTLIGTSESGRTQEVQVQQLGIGGDFHAEHARGRLMTQFGMYSTMTPRNDASPSRGQWNLADAYRYISEAYGGYHIDKMHGINIDAGIFMSNPGRYLVLVPPINGATATSGTPYFTENPGDQFKAWDLSATLDVMPDEFTTWRIELNHRAANVPYFAGEGGVTPIGGNSGAPGSVVTGFTPDLRRSETRLNVALLVKF